MGIDDIVGQEHLIGNQGPITRLIKNGANSSIILYGPPGSGKTTLANIIAKSFNVPIINANGATSQKKKFQEVVEYSKTYGKVIAVIDEIHRLNRQLQDYLLPFLESDTLYIIGTTTENPYFEVCDAIRSRSLMFQLNPLNEQDILKYLSDRADKENIKMTEDTLTKIGQMANGDVRLVNNMYDFLTKNYDEEEITANLVDKIFAKNIRYDQKSTGHFDLLSALQKSIRGDDVNAALYYLARLIIVGDYSSLLRRLVIIAYEDVGLANPQLCSRTVSAVQAFERVGMPEGRIILATITSDLALSPKSNSAYLALAKANYEIENESVLNINPMIKHTQEEEYKYSPEKAKTSDLLPYKLQGKNFYEAQLTSKYEYLLNQRHIERKKKIKK